MNLKFKMQKELIIFNFYHYLPVWIEAALVLFKETRRQNKISNMRSRSITLQKYIKQVHSLEGNQNIILYITKRKLPFKMLEKIYFLRLFKKVEVH